MDLTRQDKYWLGDFEIDPSGHSITGPAGSKTVRASSMEILCLLASQPARYCGAEELLHSIFPASGEPHGLLTACMDELRDSFGDSRPPFRFIAYDPEHGYRLLIAPRQHDVRSDELTDWFGELKRRRVFRVVGAYAVSAWLILQVVDVLTGALPVPDWTLTAATVALAVGFPIAALLAWVYQVTPQGIVAEARVGALTMDRSRLVHYLDLMIIGALLIAVAFLSYGHVFPELQRGEEVRVAVLPFENLSGESSDAYLSEGIADDIRSRLYDLPQVLVAARSSSRSLSNRGFDIRAIGERLGVQHILEGTFRRVDDRIRLSVRLVDVESGFNRWDETYDTRIQDVLAVQNRISLIVASELRVVLTTDVRKMLAENATDDPVAYELYLQARNYLDQPHEEENLLLAADFFERAIDRDPNMALSYAGLCETLIARYRDSGDTALVQPAERNCNKALSLDIRLAEVHTALGGLYTISGDLGGAEKSFNAAIALDPRAVDARARLGDIYEQQGRIEDAEAQFILAIELLPANWSGYSAFGRFLIRQQRFEEAIANYERAVELAPGNSNGYNNLGVIYYYLGDYQQAADNYRRSLEIDPDGSAFSNTGTLYYFAGDFAAAEEMFLKAVEQKPTDYRIWGNLGDAQRFTGAPDESVRASYERAVELANLRLEVNPRDKETLLNLAWYYANLGRDVAARSTLESAAPGSVSDPGQVYVIALVNALLGDRDTALRARSRAATLGFPQAMIDATPEFADLSANES
ncbi:MAG: tetratricopeptide repeat protein [Chromatiales bacterium]|nr:MAG: tetratricopeptide repeat protein [Chromatiales bacterium]